MTRPSRLAAIALRVHAAAAVMLPRAIRDRFADDIRATMRARLDEAAARGPAAVVALLARELLDLAFASARARRGDGAGEVANGSPFPTGASTVSAILHDLRYALRLLRRQPAFTAIAVITLAVGVGATTAMFTVVDGVLLRPLPYADSDRLLLLLNGRNGRLSTSFSPPNYRDAASSGAFAAAAAFDASSVNLTGEGEPQRLQAASVTGAFFRALGVRPRAGRAIDERDVVDNRRVVVLSDGLWRRLFGARENVVGRVLRLDGQPYEVIGVAAPGVTLPGTPDVWRPLVFTPANLSDAQRGAQWVGVIGRLKDGLTLQQANAAVAIVADRLAREFPNTNQGRQMIAARLQERIVRGVRPALLVLLGAVLLVLLIACVNVANLLLARAGSRAREVAVRAAVGAGRARLVAQFLVESLALGALGTMAGIAVAWASTRSLVALAPAGIPRMDDVAIDGRALAFAAIVAGATSVLFGLVPALATTASSFSQAIARAGRGSVGAGGTRARRALVIGETALAVVLLAGAGLLVRSSQRLSAVDPGFSADHVLTFHIALPEAKYPTAAAVQQMVTRFVDRLGGLPGVERAAAVFGLPLDSDFSASSSFTRTGEADSADAPSAGFRVVSPGYFAALRIPLRAGRLFDERDDSAGAEVVLINEEAARRYWPDRSPIGQQIKVAVRLVTGVGTGLKTIVGVVGDVKYGGLDVTAPPEIYLPYAQQPVDTLTIAVRTAGDPLDAAPAARAELAALDPELPTSDVRTMAALVVRSIAERRFTMLLLASFAAIAVLLAAIGVYGVLAYLVAQRTQEIGVRLALGATPRTVVRLFVRDGAMLAGTGLAAGLGAALAAGRALASLVFGVSTTDPATFAGVAAAMAITALAAIYVPARRAARVDPMEALRVE